MSFVDAVKTVYLQKYATFSGRARRSEYWWAYLFSVIVSLIGEMVARIGAAPVDPNDLTASTGYGPLLWVYVVMALAMVVPTLAVAVRRLHDIGRSGWWLLIALVPFLGVILLIVWACFDSQAGDNQYGPNPKAVLAYQA